MDEKKVFLKRFEEKLKKQLDDETLQKLKGQGEFSEEDFTSEDYERFRQESLPMTLNLYEKIANFSEKILPIQPDKKTREKLEKDLYKAHLACTPVGATSFALFLPLILIVSGLFLFVLLGSASIGFGIVLLGLLSYFATAKIPALLAKRMRSKASDQIIIAIFYIVAFMRFSSNFELATSFAANYLSNPLSLDFKRLLWELENAKYPTIKVAFDKYLEEWRDDNLEFLEAIYLIESSLYESEEFRRISLLDKALDTILQGNYEKMLHFAQSLRGKVSTFNMVGIILPILGLIILPLAASFGDPKATWEIVFILYDILLPICVAYFAFIIIFNRPSSVNAIKPPEEFFKKKNKKSLIKILGKEYLLNPKVPALLIFFAFMFVASIPFLIHGTGIESSINSVLEGIFGFDSPFGTFQEFKKIDPDGGLSYTYGPYGVYPALLSLLIPLGIAYSLGFYLKHKYKSFISLRDKTKNLEREFPSATFQLGNRINEGISAELAFGAVAETMKGTEAGEFFSKIDANIKFSGMSVEKAIFDPEKGAIVPYPSDLIISSMKIFMRSIQQGPEIAAKTLIDLSKYLSEIHRSNERMLDLLAESLGSMKGQANFLAPVISSVVISIVFLVTMIMGTLSKATAQLAADSGGAGVAGFLGESIPTYLFQASVGFYIVTLIAILVFITTNLEHGEDPIQTGYLTGEKMIGGMMKYSVLCTLGILLFAFIGWKVLGSIV